MSTGNRGSDREAIESFFVSLLNENDKLYILDTLLDGSSSHPQVADTRIFRVPHAMFEIAGVKIGICNGFQFHLNQVVKPNEMERGMEVQIFPSLSTLFEQVPDLLLHSHSPFQRVERAEGLVLLSPGPLAGRPLLCMPMPSETENRLPEKERPTPPPEDLSPFTEGAKNDLLEIYNDQPNSQPIAIPVDHSEETSSEEVNKVEETSIDEKYRPSFMLISLDQSSILVYKYSLQPNGTVDVEEISLGHPRPTITPPEE